MFSNIENGFYPLRSLEIIAVLACDCICILKLYFSVNFNSILFSGSL